MLLSTWKFAARTVRSLTRSRPNYSAIKGGIIPSNPLACLVASSQRRIHRPQLRRRAAECAGKWGSDVGCLHLTRRFFGRSFMTGRGRRWTARWIEQSPVLNDLFDLHAVQSFVLE